MNTALRAYEQSKASSRVVKVRCKLIFAIYPLIFLQYGAEMMESSMRSISKPVIDRLPVNQLDDFACRQLDRVSFQIFTAIYSKRTYLCRRKFGKSAPPAPEIDRERTPNPELPRQINDQASLQEQTNGRTSKTKFKVGGDEEDSRGMA